jgi:hypothetical protein
MSKRESMPLACLDANLFLTVIIPEATQAPKNEIAGAASRPIPISSTSASLRLCLLANTGKTIVDCRFPIFD